MMGNLVATTGPDARKFVTPAAGSRKNSWLVKSTRAAIVHASPLSLPAQAGHPVCNARAMRQMRAISRILWLNWISLRLKLHSKRHSDIGYRHPITDEQTGAPAFGYPAKDQRELAAECGRLKSMLVPDKRSLPEIRSRAQVAAYLAQLLAALTRRSSGCSEERRRRGRSERAALE